MKVIIISFLLVVCHFKSYSQKMELGIRDGINISSLIKDTSHNKIALGFNAGIFMVYHINNKFSLQTEVLWSQKGASTGKSKDYTYNSLHYNHFSKLLNYIDVPVFIRYNTPSGFFILLGPQVSFLLNAKYTYTNDNQSKISIPLDLNRKMDYGLSGGFGYELKNNFSFCLRGNVGLRNLYMGNSNLYVRNILAQATVAYTIKCKKY